MATARQRSTVSASRQQHGRQGRSCSRRGNDEHHALGNGERCRGRGRCTVCITSFPQETIAGLGRGHGRKPATDGKGKVRRGVCNVEWARLTTGTHASHPQPPGYASAVSARASPSTACGARPPAAGRGRGRSRPRRTTAAAAGRPSAPRTAPRADCPCSRWAAGGTRLQPRPCSHDGSAAGWAAA